jgi:pimeloyl-ACP methyl ester carboxylesterase
MTDSDFEMQKTEIEGSCVYFHHRTPAEANKGRLFYIHGTGCRAQVFKRHLSVISEDYEVVAVDLPGHGRSEGNGFRGVVDYAACCAGLIRGLSWSESVIVGHSMGGGIALALAIYEPELVSALVLVDSGARLRVAPAIIKNARAIASGLKKAGGDVRVGFSPETPDAIIGSVIKDKGFCDPNVVVKDWLADDSCDFLSRVPDISQRTLAVVGSDDNLTPVKHHQFLVDNMQNCQLRVIKNAGHWPFSEQPQEFDNTIIDFLRELSSAI